jgi:hypothetical protein
MKEESLNEIRNSIIDLIHNSNIPIEDKLELMINIRNFLAPKKYRENIRILRRKR